MKHIFSCSDFLSDLWQGGLDGAEPLDPLANACSSEGGTLLGGARSTDLLSLLGQTEEADSRMMRSLAASSTNKQDSAGTVSFVTHKTLHGMVQARCRSECSHMHFICMYNAHS